jgi:hypothetical protein
MVDPDVARLTAAHGRLMRAYLDVLTRLDSLPFFPTWATLADDSAPERWMRRTFGLVILRSFVTLFVHSHLLGRSKALRAAYIQRAQGLDSEQQAARTWLFDTADSLEDFEKTLDTFTSLKGLANLAWPIAVGFYLAWSGADNLYSALLKLSLPPVDTLLAAAMFPVVYFLLFLSSAFVYKRELFFPGDAGPVRFTDWAGPNIYALENEMFDSIGRRKHKEFPFDIFCYSLGMGTFGGVPMYLALSRPGITWGLIVPGSFFLLLALAVPLTLRKRRWR